MATRPCRRFAFEKRKMVRIGVAHRQKAAEIAFAQRQPNLRLPQKEGSLSHSEYPSFPYVLTKYVSNSVSDKASVPSPLFATIGSELEESITCESEIEANASA